jgi:hypothetical protein
LGLTGSKCFPLLLELVGSKLFAMLAGRGLKLLTTTAECTGVKMVHHVGGGLHSQNGSSC